MDLVPEIETHHHHHTGRAWVDVVLGVSAVLISLISLVLAIANGRAMERLVQGNTWPFVMAGVGTANPQGDPRFEILLLNKGVGPAKIETLEVFFRGAPVADEHQLLRRMLGLPPQAPLPHFALLTTGIVGGVLSSKESINLLEVRPGQASKAEMDNLRHAAGQMSFRVCYCSVFDECSVLDTPRTPVVAKVKACPTPRVPYIE